MFFITFVPLNPRSKNALFVLIFGTFRFADYSLEQIFTYIFLTIVFISFIIAVGMIILFYNSFADFTRDILITFIISELVILSSTMYLFCSINPALQAISIKKRLEELES